MSSKCLLLMIGIACAIQAQNRDFGVFGGGGVMNALPVQGAAASAVSATAGFGSGIAAGVLVGQDLYSRLGGEIRYLFEQRNLQIQSGGTAARFQGQAHVVHYDLLFHTRPRKERVRPYLAAGGGVKIFRGTGAEAAYRPLMDYAYLTRTLEWKPMFSVGGGVKIQLGRRTMLRVDFRDQVTRFPTTVITPAPGLNLSGWLHDFVPTVGFGWEF